MLYPGIDAAMTVPIAQFMPATDSRNGLADPFGRTLAAAPIRRAFEQFRTSREVGE